MPLSPLEWSRPLAFPVWAGIWDLDAHLDPWEEFVAQPADEWGNKYAGRFIDDRNQIETGHLNPRVLECAGPEDIVFVHLWCGNSEVPGRGTDAERLSTYEDQLRCIDELAPRVKAIAVGNGGEESGFAHVLLKPWEHGRVLATEQYIEWIERAAPLVTERGGRACISPICMSWFMALYVPDSPDLFGCLKRHNTLLHSFMAGEQWFPELRPLLQDVEGKWVPHECRETWPYPRLRAQLGQFDAIGGISYREQLTVARDLEMLAQGFRGGTFCDFWFGGG